MMRHSLLLLCSVGLLSCMSQEDMSQYMLGSWQGHEAERSWCATYARVGEDITAEMYIKEPNVTLNNNYENAFRVIRREGFLITGRGKRFHLNLANTHNSNGEEIPGEQRGGVRTHYFISSYSEKQFTYQSAGSEKQYKNLRVADCNELKTAFKKHVEILKEKVKAS